MRIRYHVVESELVWDPWKPKERNGYTFTWDYAEARKWAEAHRPAIIIGGGRLLEELK